MVPSIRIVSVGDLALAGSFLQRARPAGMPLTFPFALLQETFRNVDLFIVNLEGPFSNSGPARPGRTALLHNEPELLDWLATFPCCVCCLANNHIMDFGVEGLVRTRDLLSSRGIQFVGAGLNAREANRPLRLLIKGMLVSLLAFTSDEVHVGSVLATESSPGCGGAPIKDNAVTQISASAVDSDAVIVLLHAGFEFFDYPTPQQAALAREFVAAGATLVIGHHPHVQQGVEKLKNSLICHSLGNFLLPEIITANGRLQYRKPITKQYAILHAELAQKRVVEWRVDGGRCDQRYRLVPYQGQRAKKFSAYLGRISNPLGQTNYPEIWSTYAARRKRELRRESVRDAAAKLFLSGPKSVFRTFSVKDITRNVGRLFGRREI